MKVTVLHEFADISDFTLTYSKGDEIEVTDKRADDLIRRGLAAPAASSQEKAPAAKGKNKPQQAAPAESKNA